MHNSTVNQYEFFFLLLIHLHRWRRLTKTKLIQYQRFSFKSNFESLNAHLFSLTIRINIQTFGSLQYCSTETNRNAIRWFVVASCMLSPYDCTSKRFCCCWNLILADMCQMEVILRCCTFSDSKSIQFEIPNRKRNQRRTSKISHHVTFNPDWMGKLS